MCADKRAYSLDALRGYAILTMILSATIAFGILPGWMYHAQVPPPDHHFDPTVYGITWVDLFCCFRCLCGSRLSCRSGDTVR